MRLSLIGQPQISLVYQSCRLQRVSRTLATQVAARQPMELVVYQGHQLFQSALVTPTPSFEELRDTLRRTCRHLITSFFSVNKTRRQEIQARLAGLGLVGGSILTLFANVMREFAGAFR